MNKKEIAVQKALGTLRTYKVFIHGYDSCDNTGKGFIEYVDATSAEAAKQKVFKRHKILKLNRRVFGGLVVI